MRIEISRLHFPVTTLGPGRRIGIWFQGCSIRCKDCISADTWAAGRGVTSVEEVLASIETWLAVSDGITVSGGEPFDQPMALHALLAGIRTRTANDVLVFSGHPMESIHSAIAEMTGLIDALITDPYDAEAPNALALRGSDNQRLHLLTPLGVARFSACNGPADESGKALDLMFDEDGTVWIAGIPRRDDMRRLTALLAANGHWATTSQAAAGDKDVA